MTTELRWPVRASFLRYLAALPDARASVSDGAALTPDDPQLVIYPADPGASSDTILAFRGDLRLSGHRGLLFVRLADPWIEIDVSGRSLLTVAHPTTTDGNGQRMPLVRLTLTATEGGWSGTDVRLCPDGVPLFNHVYEADAEFDPLIIQ